MHSELRQSQQQFDWQLKNQWDQSQHQPHKNFSILKRPQLSFLKIHHFARIPALMDFILMFLKLCRQCLLHKKSRSNSSCKNLISEMFDTRFCTFLSVAQWNVSLHCWWWTFPSRSPNSSAISFIFYRHWKLSISSPSTRRQGSFLSSMLFPI